MYFIDSLKKLSKLYPDLFEILNPGTVNETFAVVCQNFPNPKFIKEIQGLKAITSYTPRATQDNIDDILELLGWQYEILVKSPMEPTWVSRVFNKEESHVSVECPTKIHAAKMALINVVSVLPKIK